MNHPTQPRVQLRDELRVLEVATELADGDHERAIHWFKNEPLAAFSNQTAEELVARNRAEDVIRLLESCTAGFSG